MRFWTIVILMLTVICSVASAVTYQSAIEFQVGSVGSPQEWIPWNAFPEIGSSLWIVGVVQSFNAPFEDLLPPAGTYEATYSIEGMTCTENIMWDDFEHQIGGMGAAYSNGTLKIYIDYSPDADVADASTFRDGELVLEAQLAPPIAMGSFFLSEGGYCPVELHTLMGCFHFSGGTWFDRVSDSNGQGYNASTLGCFWGNISEDLRQMGYVGQSLSQVDIYSTVAVEATSWGKIKSMYR